MTQDTRTAAMLADFMEIFDEDRSVCEDLADGLARHIAAVGYTIAGPGQVVVERDMVERLQEDARDWASWVVERGWGETWSEYGDLDPLPTREGE